jgi:hypothetical protein
MKQTNITPEIAKDMYQSGIDSLKQLAVLNYPDLFSEQKKWSDFGVVKGAYIDSYSVVCRNVNFSTSHNDNKNTYPTTKEAESALALSQLCQWRDKVNGEPLSDWADWTDNDQEKYCIIIHRNVIDTGISYNTFHDLTFKTPEIRDQFLKDHKDLLEIWASKSRK